MVPVECYFALSALLFFIGVYGFVTRRNLIAMLISVELVLNAVDINFAHWCCCRRECCGYCDYSQCLSPLQERQR